MLRTIQTSTLCLLIALFASGCMKHTYKVGNGGDVESEAAYDKWESHWFFGIIGETNVEVNDVCPSGNATVKDQQSFLNGLVAAFIGIVWTPTTVEIYCAEGGGPDQSGIKGAAGLIDDVAEAPGDAIDDELEGDEEREAE